MKRNPKRAAAAPQPRSRASDAAVFMSMALVAGAVAVALVVQAGYETSIAAAISVAALAGFIFIHAILRRRQTKQPAQQRAALRRPDESRSIPRHQAAPKLPGAGAFPNAAGTTPPPLPPAAVLEAQQPMPPPLPPQHSPSLHDPLSAVPGKPAQAPPPGHVPPHSGATGSEAPQLPPMPPPQIPEQQIPEHHPSPNPKKDYWSFAPGAPSSGDQPSALPPETQANDPSFELPPLSALPDPLPEPPRQKDVEVIQGLIKKLADEVNATDQKRTDGQDPAAPSETPESSLEASLTALRTTASTMRNASPSDGPSGTSEPAAREGADAPNAASETADNVPPPLPEQRHSKAAALSAAVQSGRIDVLLEPILGLGDQRAQHYEVSLRLRDPAGAPLEIESEDGDLRGTGFLPLVDGARIARTINIARRLGERGKDGSVFSAYSGESLTADGFLSDISSALEGRPATAGQLVLTFSQNDVRGFEAPEWIALADLSRLGFRFALADVSDLDMDFESLARSGFSFVKLEADVFLEGLHAPEGLLPAADICRHFAGLGMTLVVQGIDSGMKLAKIFGFGVLLGQGQLFGGPRPLRAEAIAGHQDAAA